MKEYNSESNKVTPVLYSFRRCPYAMRARLAVQYSGEKVELREVDLKDKPEEMLSLAKNSTVPILLLPDGSIIEESWDIMIWALRKNDPDLWLGADESYLFEAEMLIEMNDYSFKPDLDHYKYADRHPEHPVEHYRAEGEEFLQDLEEALSQSKYLLGDTISVADIGIVPFIRQFAFVDKPWFDQAPYPKLQSWLQEMLRTKLFESMMPKLPVWKPGDQAVIFPS
ncbi:MAG: glutathione S-transferase [Gammaproteobacteria bacterium]|nr:glutathione S-transferase [Gammaproteobacteria bacterium]MDX2486101.1 glutathione S-transferase [Gammaproteobacteria bacterium]